MHIINVLLFNEANVPLSDLETLKGTEVGVAIL